MKDHFALAHSVFEETVQIRRRLHQNPELSGEEHQTLAFIAEYLNALDIPFVSYSNGGICACIGKGKTAVGIRADIDALPISEETGLPYASRNFGVMHACGHDIHTAILLGAAKLFKEMEEELPGMVKLFFQPAEETVGGAEVMVREGCMESPKVEYVLGLHVDPAFPVGTAAFLPGKMNAAVTELSVTVQGKSCHGAHPEQGVDAIAAAAYIVTALQGIDSRMTAPTEPVVVTIGSIKGGSKNNIIAGEVQMEGTIRTLSREMAENVKAQVTRTIEGVAAAWGAEADVVLEDNFPALINDSSTTMAVASEAQKLLGEKNVIFLETPSMGADDFAYFANAAKGCYFSIGTAVEGEPFYSLHSEHYAPSEDCIPVGLVLTLAGALKLLEKCV